jgi:hypothetical protein
MSDTYPKEHYPYGKASNRWWKKTCTKKVRRENNVRLETEKDDFSEFLPKEALSTRRKWQG